MRLSIDESRYAPAVTPEVEELLARSMASGPVSSRSWPGSAKPDARRSTVGSGTNLAGLLQHLTFVESMWFEEIVAGGTARRGKRSMEVDPSVSLRTLRADYRAACAASNEIITALGDADRAGDANGKTRDLRWAILVVVEETAGTRDTPTSSASRSTAGPAVEVGLWTAAGREPAALIYRTIFAIFPVSHRHLGG